MELMKIGFRKNEQLVNKNDKILEDNQLPAL